MCTAVILNDGRSLLLALAPDTRSRYTPRELRRLFNLFEVFNSRNGKGLLNRLNVLNKCGRRNGGP
jgi:hypothetical protein